MYSAVVLNESCRFRLQDRFVEFLRVNDFENRRLIQDWKFYCHHMTMHFRNVPRRDYEWSEKETKEGKGVAVRLSVSHYGFFEDSVCALKVNSNSLCPDLSSNETPHITMACGLKGKPVMSNKITNWTRFRPMEVIGVIKIINN